MRPKNCRGSIAIFFCLLVTALSLVLSSWLAVARQRSHEADLARAMQAQLDLGLAGFDQKLHDQYGLFAFVPTALDQSAFQKCLPPGLRASSQLDFSAPLLDSQILDQQIVRRMKARLPGSWLDLWQSRYKLFSANLAGLAPTRAGPASQAATVLLNSSASSLTELFSDQLQELSGAAIRQASQALFGKTFAELEENLLNDAQAQYQAYAREKLAVPDSSPLVYFLGNTPDFMSPASLSKSGAALDQLFDFTTVPLYEKLCLVEYGMTHLTCRTPFTVSGTGTSYQLAPNGQRLSDLLLDRPNEIEQLLTGSKDPKAAAATVRFILISCRSLIHLAAILTDETKMASIRSSALAFSAALAAMSVGAVLIDPQVISYILIAGQAIWAGIRETDALVSGKGVRFWPGRGNLTFELYYQDYLRIFLCAVPRASLVERTAGLISQNLNRPLYTGLTIRADWAGRCYQLAGGYQ